jgi:HD domain
MSTDGPASDGGAARRAARATNVYVVAVVEVGLALTATAVRLDGIAIDAALGVMVLLASLTWWLGSVEVDNDRVQLSFASIILLASMALLGPAGAGVVGIIVGPLQRGPVPWRARFFNTGMLAVVGVSGGAVYLAAGGLHDAQDLVGTWEIVRQIGIPILVADIAQALLNLVLIAGVVRLSQGVPMRTQMGRLLGTSGPAYLGYGAIAFILVVLWEPAGLGPASVVLVLPPLIVAQWAYRQYAEEVKGHERALQVLVAAVEAKAPHLSGHSARVAELCAHMAEHLGLRPQAVADIRTGGMLHDLGLTTLPTALVRGSAVGADGPLRDYPTRGAHLLQDLSFLSGSVDAITHHRVAVTPGADIDALGMPSLVVGLADEYDLLTEVGTPDGAVLSRDEALARLRTTPAGREDLVRTLEQALSRRSNVTAG